MEDRLQKIKAFHLTGRRDGSLLTAPGDDLRPVLLSRFTDLASLRYDLPVILNRRGVPDRALLSLSALVDEAVSPLEGDERDRIARHGYAIEQAVRRLLADGSKDFRAVWNEAARAVGEKRGNEVEASAEWLLMAFGADGEACLAEADLADRMVRHCWETVSAEKYSAMRERIRRLIVKLEGILAAEAAGSAAGRAPESLMAGVGTSYSGAFDFEAMSRILTAAKPEAKISDERRERICELIEELKEQRFYSAAGESQKAYGFWFEHPSEALRAYKERHDDALRFIRALKLAELESAGDFRDAVHGRLFEDFGANGLDSGDIAELPEYMVCCGAGELDASETADLVEMLAAGVPFNVLVRTDDVLRPSPVAEGHVSVGLRARQLVQTAIGLTDVYVLQTPASRLYADRELILKGLRFSGPALFSVYSGSNSAHEPLDPFLASAAALGARAFPVIAYDPEDSDGQASPLVLSGNPQPGEDWETHEFQFEDEKLQSHSETAPFTFADLLFTDSRFRDHFALVPKDYRPEEMVPMADAVAGPDTPSDVLPYITLADGAGHVHRAVADYRVLNETRRCRTMWRNLTAGGRQAAARAVPEEAPPEETQGAADEPEVSTKPASPEKTVTSDEPYIETARCTSCNECTQINGKMFAYDENKQAYIADPDAGTFRELVEAAESCQVSIIHPGKPRNPKEPGLEDLIRRAEDFN